MTGLVYRLMMVTVVGMFAGHAIAEIYRYQDQNGKWHFTDQRPKPTQPADVVTYDALAVDSKIMDLEAALTYKFNPQSMLQRSSLAVVTVESPVTKGVGFFISPRGYLITHRHIVRPAETASWRKSKAALDNQRVKLDGIKRELQQRQQNLESMAQLAASKEAAMQTLSGDKKVQATRDYRFMALRLADQQEDVDNYQEFYRQRKGEYERANAKFAVLSATALSTREFQVLLKDRTQLTASLVAVSDAYELALLKVSGIKTPFIDYATAHASVKGARVYAIGSPAEREDPVTAGVITHVFKEVLVTDMALHATENGGPLINNTGQLVGVSTSVPVARNIDPELFGAAVPSHTLQREFGTWLKPELAQN